MQSRVRALGWENLERPLSELSIAITQTLEVLGVPYSVAEHSGNFGCAFVVQPPQPTVPPELDGMLGDMQIDGMLDGQPSPRLKACIHIFAAEAGSTMRHHVSMRRQSGRWVRWKAFYAAFRREFSLRIGFTDDKQLSMYSPLVTKREAPTRSPAAGWKRELPPVADISEGAIENSPSPPNPPLASPQPASSCPWELMPRGESANSFPGAKPSCPWERAPRASGVPNLVLGSSSFTRRRPGENASSVLSPALLTRR